MEDQLRAIKDKIIGSQFDGKMQSALAATPYTGSAVTDIWRANATHALRFTSPLALGIDNAQFRVLVEKLSLCNGENQPLTMLEVAIASNNLESRTAEQLELSLGNYLNFMDAAAEVSKEWNEKSTILRDQVIKEIEESINLKQAQPQQVGGFGGKPAEA